METVAFESEIKLVSEMLVISGFIDMGSTTLFQKAQDVITQMEKNALKNKNEN
jgi:hypothetical protein